jgi:ankyrin repeat protein
VVSGDATDTGEYKCPVCEVPMAEDGSHRCIKCFKVHHPFCMKKSAFSEEGYGEEGTCPSCTNTPPFASAALAPAAKSPSSLAESPSSDADAREAVNATKGLTDAEAAASTDAATDADAKAENQDPMDAAATGTNATAANQDPMDADAREAVNATKGLTDAEAAAGTDAATDAATSDTSTYAKEEKVVTAAIDGIVASITVATSNDEDTDDDKEVPKFQKVSRWLWTQSQLADLFALEAARKANPTAGDPANLYAYLSGSSPAAVEQRLKNATNPHKRDRRGEDSGTRGRAVASKTLVPMGTVAGLYHAKVYTKYEYEKAHEGDEPLPQDEISSSVNVVDNEGQDFVMEPEEGGLLRLANTCHAHNNCVPVLCKIHGVLTLVLIATMDIPPCGELLWPYGNPDVRFADCPKSANIHSSEGCDTANTDWTSVSAASSQPPAHSMRSSPVAQLPSPTLPPSPSSASSSSASPTSSSTSSSLDSSSTPTIASASRTTSLVNFNSIVRFDTPLPDRRNGTFESRYSERQHSQHTDSKHRGHMFGGTLHEAFSKSHGRTGPRTCQGLYSNDTNAAKLAKFLSGESTEVKSYLCNDLDRTDRRTPLSTAVCNNAMLMVETLVAGGASLETSGHIGQTRLNTHPSCHGNRVLHVSRGGKREHLTPVVHLEQGTALATAVAFGHHDLAKWLIAHGSDPLGLMSFKRPNELADSSNAKSAYVVKTRSKKQHATTLALAIFLNKGVMVDMLLQAVSKANIPFQSAWATSGHFFDYEAHGHPTVTGITAIMGSHYCGQTLLEYAALTGSHECLMPLLQFAMTHSENPLRSPNCSLQDMTPYPVWLGATNGFPLVVTTLERCRPVSSLLDYRYKPFQVTKGFVERSLTNTLSPHVRCLSATYNATVDVRLRVAIKSLLSINHMSVPRSDGGRTMPRKLAEHVLSFLISDREMKIVVAAHQANWLHGSSEELVTQNIQHQIELCHSATTNKPTTGGLGAIQAWRKDTYYKFRTQVVTALGKADPSTDIEKGRVVLVNNLINEDLS